MFEHSSCFRRSKSRSCSSSQTHAFLLLSNLRILAQRCATSGTKSANCAARPVKDLKSLTFVGRVKFCRDAILRWSGRMPVSDTRWPANVKELAICNFRLEIEMECCLHRSSTVVRRKWSVSSDGAQMRMSSTIFLAKFSPSTTTFSFGRHR